MNVLVCVDASEVSQALVQAVAELLRERSGDQFVLYTVAEVLPDYVQSEQPQAGMTPRNVAENHAETTRKAGEALLQRSREQLISAGIAADSVQTKLGCTDCLPESKKVAAALAIIDEMKSGQYDLVCLGRRGASELKVSLIGGVTEKVLREGHGRAILVIDAKP